MPYCNYLTKESKITFNEEVLRDSPTSKLNGLMDKSILMLQ